jgi:membrane-bound ClpP family serine protease
MNTLEALPVLVKMVCSFLAAFTAIALWSRTRDAAWTLMVLGAVFLFIESLYSTLVIIGLATYQVLVWNGFPLLESVLSGLPPVLFSAGFLTFLMRDRHY